MNQANDSVVVNIVNIDLGAPPWFGRRCIYKVHKKLRKVNPEAYTPQVVSIGPLHYVNSELIPMEKEKKKYREKFKERLHQTQQSNDHSDVDTILKTFNAFITKHGRKILNHYEEDAIDPSILPEKSLEVIELDAIFIIELFLRKIETEQRKHEDDYILSKPWLSLGVMHDLILLENQLPFHVLERLYELVPEKTESFLEVARKYFAKLDPERKSEEVKLKSFNEIKHFTDLIRHFYLPLDLSQDSDNQEVHPWFSASDLEQSGVNFTPITNRCLLDIRFEKKEFMNWLPFLSCLPFLKCVKARYEIPELVLDDSTQSIFRNLIAFEQCHCPGEAYVCSYVLLINHLLGTQSDVDLLVDRKVINNRVGSNEAVAVLVSSLCKEVLKTTNCYTQDIRRLDQHNDNIWNRYMATLKRVYFCDLWRASSTVVGLAVLFFTFFNFFNSVLKGKKENYLVSFGSA